MGRGLLWIATSYFWTGNVTTSWSINLSAFDSLWRIKVWRTDIVMYIRIICYQRLALCLVLLCNNSWKFNNVLPADSCDHLHLLHPFKELASVLLYFPVLRKNEPIRRVLMKIHGSFLYFTIWLLLTRIRIALQVVCVRLIDLTFASQTALVFYPFVWLKMAAAIESETIRARNKLTWYKI